jgi:hypothetical protein
MAIDPVALVTQDLQPLFLLDAALEATITPRVAAMQAMKGWSTLTDQQAVYIALLTTKALIPRILGKFSQEVQKVKGGKSEVDLVKAIEYLNALREEIDEMLSMFIDVEGGSIPPGVDPKLMMVRWPGIGPVGWHRHHHG